MGGHRTICIIIATMMTGALIFGGVAIGILYDTAFEQRRADLIQAAQSHARMMEAVAHYDQTHSRNYPVDALSATILPAGDSQENYGVFGETGELTMARRVGDEIVFLLRRHQYGLGTSGSVAIDSPHAEPMRRALAGESGTMVGPDYRGVTVLASYEPVAINNLGVVAKIDLVEIRAPFLRVGGIVFVISLALIAVGTALFLRASNPLVRRIQESEARLNVTLANLIEGVVTIDETGIIRSFNPAAERIFGYTAEEAIGRNVKILVPEPDHGKHDGYIRHYLETGEARIIGNYRESTGQRKDGTTFPLELGVAEMRLGDQRSFVGTLRDITKRKRVEEQLRASEDRLRRSVLEAPIPIMLHADDGEVLMISKRWTELSGYFHADIPTILDWSEKACCVTSEHMQGLIRELYEIEEPIEDEVCVTTAWGEQRTWDFRTAPLGRLPDGRRFVISMAVDITPRRVAEAKRKRLEAQLRQAQKMEAIGTLAGGIAHDFNNILAGMAGYAHLAIDAVPAKGQVHGDLECLLKGIDRATSLVKQILAFSRRDDADSHPVEIGREVEKTLDLLRASIFPAIEIRRNIDREAGMVLADATQLQQIVMNLCTNAVDAIGPGPGVIEVGLTRVEISDADTAARLDLVPGSYVKLSVSDCGGGMDAATQSRVFEPFFTTKEPGKGTGLGLSVVHGIIVGHGGTIEVDSAPGRGTTYTILLPRAEAVKCRAAPVERNVPRGSERILLVDDEAAIVRSEKRLFEQLGYKVEVATSSLDALEKFRAAPQTFDLVITDQSMPELSGMDLACEILNIRGDTPIILCSGLPEAGGAGDTTATMIREFMTKPIYPDDLARAVRRALDHDV